MCMNHFSNSQRRWVIVQSPKKAKMFSWVFTKLIYGRNNVRWRSNLLLTSQFKIQDSLRVGADVRGLSVLLPRQAALPSTALHLTKRQLIERQLVMDSSCCNKAASSVVASCLSVDRNVVGRQLACRHSTDSRAVWTAQTETTCWLAAHERFCLTDENSSLDNLSAAILSADIWS